MCTCASIGSSFRCLIMRLRHQDAGAAPNRPVGSKSVDDASTCFASVETAGVKAGTEPIETPTNAEFQASDSRSSIENRATDAPMYVKSRAVMVRACFLRPQGSLCDRCATALRAFHGKCAP